MLSTFVLKNTFKEILNTNRKITEQSVKGMTLKLNIALISEWRKLIFTCVMRKRKYKY